MNTWTPLTLAALLAFALPASADPDPTGLSARCDFTTASTPNSNDAFLVLAGSAVAPGAVATGVSCELLDADGATVLALERTQAGSAVAGADHTVFAMRVLTVCTSAYAVSVDGSIVTLERSCATP